MPDEVCGGHRPHANFSGNPPQTCADKPVLFTDSSTDTYSYTTYVWDFHGGPPFLNESNQKNPSYIYNQIGTYTVTEIVANYGCADTITKDDYVQTVVPIAYPKAIQTCNNKLTVTLDGTGSTGAQSYLWTIPNGTPSSDTNAIVSVTFPASGTYSASLFVLNDSTGCSDLQPVTINISNLQAEFTAAPLSACNTLSAQFSNTSTGAAGYSWTITNQAGAFAEWSTNFLPYVLLKTPGIYNVMLIVNDSLGCKDTLIRPHYLSVDQPVAAFKAQPRDGCAPSEINMTDMSTYPLVPGKTWSWNFGDSISGGNNVSSLENPAHLYQNAGTYTVSLSIVDSEGCTANTTMLNYIQVNKPLAAFTYTSTSTCQAATICFDNTSTGQLLKYLWNFGDSTTSTATAPCHSYTTDGTYNMALIVTDSIGCKDTLTQASNVNLVVPHPNFVADTTHSSCPPLVVNFTNLSSDTNAQTTYLWNFGDGQVSSQLNPLHIYNIPGTFTVSLIAKRNGCSDTVIFTNYIFIGGPSGYAFNTPSSGCAPHNVCFSAKSSSTVSYAWNFGDGTVTPGPDSICYIYSRPGTFYPQLILTDTGGCVFAQPLGQVNISIATALFGMDSVLRCNAASVNFTDSSSGVPGIQSWSWNFGDTASRAGNISVQQNPSHYFAAPGNYQVQELVTDSAGCMDSLTRILQVTSPPAVTFAMVNPPACFSDTVFFTDQTNANANVISRMWNFGDASSGKLDTSSQVNPRHWYNVVGNYTVTLIDMSSSGCADTLKEVITMHAKPTSAFTAQNRCVNEQPISFSNGSQGASAYQWLFGDGQASVQASPQHNYASSGQYNVTLIANNGFCYDTITLPVQVYALPSSSLSLSSPYSCGNPALLNVSDQSTNIVSQFWNFGDAASGKADTSSLLNASHTYAAQGNYSVMLVTKNSNGCSDTALVKFAVYPKPVASFTVANACLNTQPIAFTNTSVGSTAYSWLFGDGDSSTLQNPVHTYQAASKYNVRLISTVEYCADTFHAPVEIYDVPGASVSLSATTFCGTPAVLSGNYGNSGGINYYWNFGDDGSGASDTSVLQNAVHRYNNAGNYTVTFITSNANGCADTSRQTVHVAATPSGTFSAMDTCLNTQPIVFSNYISNATSYTWYFGDGDSSAARSPAHTYKEAGQYVVTLVASDNTCADTLTAPVKIYALPAAAFTLSSSGMCGPPAVVSTTNNSSSANSYLWNFGNGDTSAASNPVISYSTAGTFQITLTAMNGSCRDMASDSFSVTPAPIVQGIDVAAAGGCAPVRVNFTANAPGADSYTWNFGDSSASFTSSSPNAAYTYNDTGSFTISLYVISGNGCRDSAILTDTVQVHIQPIADFDTLIYSDNYPFNGNVIFVNLSQNADNYLWEFGDGATSTDFNPQHEYGQVDTFNATLIASTNYGCVDSATRSFFVIKKALYVPNALRPDANGSEELVKVWKPLGIGLSAYHAEIYDKWGTLLWQSDSLQNTQPSESWDGTYHGQPCQQDAYVWKISATFVDGTPWPGMTYDVSEGGGTKTLGSVTLIR
jgi:PKD repeat protein